MTGEPGSTPDQDVVYYAPLGSQLQVTTIFLTGRWVGAVVQYHEEAQRLQIVQEDAHISLPIPIEE